jgi:sugar/nucleoside kinase (ribokinase family)/kynurenine formamidase
MDGTIAGGRVVSLGVHIVDTLGRPVTHIPEKQGRQLLDEIRITAAGTAAGTAVDLAKLGADVTVMGAIGNDLLADFLVSALRAHGVDTTHLAKKHAAQTSATMLPIRPNGERPALHAPGATALLAPADVDLDVIAAADVLHVGGPDVLGRFGGEPLRRIISTARAHGVITTMDVLAPGDRRTWESLRPALEQVTYFLPNEDQLRRLTGNDDLVAAARAVLALGVEAVLVSRGSAGALLVTRGEQLELPALPVDVVDTTGCGDACSAGFIAGMLRGWRLEDAGWMAMAAAALVAGGLGSDAGIVDFDRTVELLVAHAPRAVADRVQATHGAGGRPLPVRGPAALANHGRLPAYDDLPCAERGGGSAWGLFGPGDSVGLFNLQTPERIVAGARLIRSGEVYSLNAPIDIPAPPLFRRGGVRHSVIGFDGRSSFDDKLDNYYPQASSQWDSLAHVGYDADRFYNGVAAGDITAKARNTIDHWARRGIAGRAVLIDIDLAFGGAGRGFDPASSRAITVDELDAARVAAGVEWETGDVLLLHTGFLAWYMRQEADVREAMAEPGALRAVGLARDEEMARYLWDAHVAAVASDNPAVEVWPPDLSDEAFPFGYLHRILIGQFGLAIGELWWLDELAHSCRRDGRHEMFLTAAPAHIPGGIGSPANALAVK